MSSHPNVILLLRLRPDDLPMKTLRAIEAEDADGEDGYIKISETDYRIHVMEDEFFEESQISAKTGDIIVWDLVTYGYGRRISWKELEAKKLLLELWADGICQRHHCTASIEVTANYW